LKATTISCILDVKRKEATKKRAGDFTYKALKHVKNRTDDYWLKYFIVIL
jgi:hypothetical protein